MKIYTDVEIDSNDLSDNDLFGELAERLQYKYVLRTDEYQKSKEPEVDAMLAKLEEIRLWFKNPD